MALRLIERDLRLIAALRECIFFMYPYIKSLMTGAMGRPIGSKDRLPRQKRTKLQFLVDKQTGCLSNKERDVRVSAQHPCETCGSCLRVQFVNSTEGTEDPLSYDFLHALSPFVSKVGMTT